MIIEKDAIDSQNFKEVSQSLNIDNEKIYLKNKCNLLDEIENELNRDGPITKSIKNTFIQGFEDFEKKFVRT